MGDREVADRVWRGVQADERLAAGSRRSRCPHCGNVKDGTGEQLRRHRARCSKNPKNASRLKGAKLEGAKTGVVPA